MGNSNLRLESGIEDVIARESQDISNHYQLLENSQRIKAQLAKIAKDVLAEEVEIPKSPILDDEYADSLQKHQDTVKALKQIRKEEEFYSGFPLAWTFKGKQENLLALLNKKAELGILTKEDAEVAKLYLQNVYEQILQGEVKNEFGNLEAVDRWLAAELGLGYVPVPIAGMPAAEQRKKAVKKVAKKIMKEPRPEPSLLDKFIANKYVRYGLPIVTLLSLVGAATYITQYKQPVKSPDNKQYWALANEKDSGRPDIPANATSFDNVSFFPNPETIPVNVTNYSFVASHYQWYNNATGRFYDIAGWNGDINSLPDKNALVENATKDVKAIAYLLAEPKLKRSIIWHIDGYEKDLSVQKFGNLSVGGLGAIAVKAHVGLINEGPLITNKFSGGDYKIHNISFHPEFTVNVNPLNIPDKVCNIPILNPAARILADSNYLIDRSNKTIGEYNNINLKSWDGKDVSKFLKLPKAKEFVNQTLALANGKSVDNERQWFNSGRGWQPPAYGDVVIEKVNDTTALSKALIDMFPAKKTLNETGDYSLKPGQNIMNESEFNDNHSKGYAFLKKDILLGQIELVNPNNLTAWSELNKTAPASAMKWLKRYMNQTDNVTNGFYKILSTRNATDPNKIDSKAELLLQRPWLGGRIVAKNYDREIESNQSDNQYVFWLDVGNDSIQSNDIVVLVNCLGNISYQGKNISANDFESCLDWKNLGGVEMEFIGSIADAKNYTPASLTSFYPGYDVNAKLPAGRVYALQEILSKNF